MVQGEQPRLFSATSTEDSPSLCLFPQYCPLGRAEFGLPALPPPASPLSFIRNPTSLVCAQGLFKEIEGRGDRGRERGKNVNVNMNVCVGGREDNGV